MSAHHRSTGLHPVLAWGLLLQLLPWLSLTACSAQQEQEWGHTYLSLNETEHMHLEGVGYADEGPHYTWSTHASHVEAGAPPADHDDGYLPDKAHPAFMWDTCVETVSGDVQLNGTRACNLSIEGVDKHADLLRGGLDGRYLLDGCYLGKPVYVRTGSPAGAERSLFYNPYYGDWQFILAAHPLETKKLDVVMYGNYGQLSPLDVSSWHLQADYNSVEAQYVAREILQPTYFKVQGVSVTCDLDDEATTTQPSKHQAHDSGEGKRRWRDRSRQKGGEL